MAWIRRGLNRLTKAFRSISALEKESDRIADVEERLMSEIDKVYADPEVKIIQEYIPQRFVVVRDRATRQYRDVPTGRFVSLDTAQQKMSETRQFNFEQKILSVHPSMSEGDLQYFFARYDFLKDVDIDLANEYVRDMVSP